MPLAMFLSFVARCLKPTGVRDNNGNKSWEEQQPALELAYKGSRSLGRVDVYSPHAVINFILPFLTSYMLQASLCTRISWVGSLPSDPAAAIGVQSLCLLPNLDLFPHKRSSFCPCLDSSHMCQFLYKPLPMNLTQDTLHPYHGLFQQRYITYFFPSIKITHFNHSKGSATILLRFRIIKKHLGKPSSFNSTHTHKNPFSCCIIAQHHVVPSASPSLQGYSYFYVFPKQPALPYFLHTPLLPD